MLPKSFDLGVDCCECLYVYPVGKDCSTVMPEIVLVRHLFKA